MPGTPNITLVITPQLEYSHSGHLVPKWRRINVDATSSRRTDVNTTSCARCVGL